ncbi:hypothetical protein ACQ4PT_033766 [Festuca glaucescens]
MREPRPRRSVRRCKPTRDGRQWRQRPDNSTRDVKLVSQHLTTTSSDASSLQPAKARGLSLTTSFSEDEEDLLLKLHALLGNRWSIIAGRLPGRTGEEVEAHWCTPVMRTKLKRMGCGGTDPGNLDQHCEQRPRQHRGHPSGCSNEDGSDDLAVSDAGSSSYRSTCS